MLVVKPVATDVDDADHGDGKGLVRYGDAGDEEGDLSRVSAAKDELVYSVLRVLLAYVIGGERERGGILPMMRSGPMVRETVLRCVSGGLLAFRGIRNRLFDGMVSVGIWVPENEVVTVKGG